MQAYLKQLPENASSIQAAFSAQTSALNMQDILESKLDKLRKNLLGAPPGRQTVILQAVPQSWARCQMAVLRL